MLVQASARPGGFCEREGSCNSLRSRMADRSLSMPSAGLILRRGGRASRPGCLALAGGEVLTQVGFVYVTVGPAVDTFAGAAGEPNAGIFDVFDYAFFASKPTATALTR